MNSGLDALTNYKTCGWTDREKDKSSRR